MDGVRLKANVSPAIDRLWTEIDRRQDELVETVAELVRRPSPLGEEAEAQVYVASHLRESDLDVDAWDLDESVKSLPNAGDSGVPFPAARMSRRRLPAPAADAR